MLDAFHDWHDFYVLVGTASATLIGAMFVVASIGSGHITHESAATTRAFVTPTVIHLSAALIGSIVTMVPALAAPWAGVIFGLGGIAGLAYSGAVLAEVRRRRKLVWSDRAWYALIPIVGYAAALAAAALFFLRDAASLDVLAPALVLLLVAGIRNAWDLILYFVAEGRRPG